MNGFLDALGAGGPAPDRADKMALYGQFVGSWDLDVVEYAVAQSNRYGTTLRVYDPGIDAWHIAWTEPVGQTYLTMIGRAQGNDIVQLGKNAAGQALRWGFYEITPDSFLWRGEASADGETNWKRVVELRARRR